VQKQPDSTSRAKVDINQSISQYAFNTTVTIMGLHGYKA